MLLICSFKLFITQYLVLISTLEAFCYGTVARNWNKIVGGVNTTIKAHPYQVSIQIQSYYTTSEHVCGGSLINNITVLTAAHCMLFNAKRYSVRAGSSFKSSAGTIIDVLSYSRHPKYTNSNVDYDVAIIKLKNAFNFSDEIKPIDLQPVNPIIKDGTFATVTGWGVLQSEGSYPIILQKVNVAKINHSECILNYKFAKPKMKVTSRMVCYSSSGKDSCQGDSGGPLVAGNLQVGIVSWGISCANSSFPGVYTNIQNKEIHRFICSKLK